MLKTDHLMPHFYLRLTLIPIALFTLVLIVIHAQPYDDHELRELLLPEGCPAPCFMGIRPEVTTVDEAMKILESSGWVENIENGSIYGVENISWHWSNQKPKGIRSDSVGQIEFRNQHVTWIMFSTNFSVGEVRLALGSPDAESVDGTEDPISEYAFYSAYYNRYGFSVDSSYPCDVIEPLRGTTSILISSTIYPPSEFDDSLNDVFHVC
jgi:hypothetical protein